MLATVLVQVSVRTTPQSAAGGSFAFSVGVSDPPAGSFAYQLPNIIGQVSISSATLNAAAQSAFLASGASLT